MHLDRTTVRRAVRMSDTTGCLLDPLDLDFHLPSSIFHHALQIRRRVEMALRWWVPGSGYVECRRYVRSRSIRTCVRCVSALDFEF